MPARIPTRRPVRRIRSLASALALALALPAAAAIPGVELVDRTTIAAHIDANGPSFGPLATSRNGRFVLFSSVASNLVAGDGNGGADLFVHDAADDSLARVNLAGDGSEANVAASIAQAGLRGSVYDDGRYVTFASQAANLVAGTTNGKTQIYRRDRVSGTTTLISRGSDGLAASSNVFVGPTTPDGRYTVFATDAANFPGGVPGALQVYRHDANGGGVVRITVTLDDMPATAAENGLEISDDGRLVLFAAFAGNLVPGAPHASSHSYLRDVVSGTTQQVSVTDTGGQPVSPSFDLPDTSGIDRLSADGRYAVFATRSQLAAGDADFLLDVYRFDRLSGTTTLVSDGPGPNPSLSPSISADGRHVLFAALPPSPPGDVRLLVRDMTSGVLTQLVMSPLQIQSPDRQSLSRDASTAYFSAINLPPANGFTQTYRFDTSTAGLRRLSVSDFPPAAHADGSSEIANRPSPSADARFVAFASGASNLVAGDGNGVFDVFVRDRWTATTERISLRANGSEGDCDSKTPTLTPDARYVVFDSCGALVAPASGAQTEVYRYDRTSHALELVSIAAGGVRADGGSLGAHVSDDGRYVAFRSCASNLAPIGSGGYACQVYLRDMDAGTTALISRSSAGQPANSYGGGDLYVSGDGRFVGYTSNASNLVTGDSNNNPDAFVFDRTAGSTERVSVGAFGAQGTGSSYFRGFDRSGNLALIESMSPNLTTPPRPDAVYQRTYLRDRGAGTTMLLALPGDTTSSSRDASISRDGRFVALISYFARSDVGAFDDQQKDKLFVLDRSDGRYRALTWFTGKRPQSQTRKPQLSADGHWIAFVSTRDDLGDDDGNGQFADVFLMRADDPIFADDFG